MTNHDNIKSIPATPRPESPRSQVAPPVPRGIRNNNPGNIRLMKPRAGWIGAVVVPTDTEFEQFISLEYGVRAMAKTLMSYNEYHQLTTVESIIDRYAPPVENKTDEYVLTCCSAVNRTPTEKLPRLRDNVGLFANLINAMIHVECGETLPLPTVLNGIKLAKL